ncbi:hypothetical protein QP185_20100 [Sphingomonas aerolata]|uniref:hypothetical protein n=1 Tax=Sphingomonas aerolata TaxID=185951 RepID=UPI002FE134DC
MLTHSGRQFTAGMRSRSDGSVLSGWMVTTIDLGSIMAGTTGLDISGHDAKSEQDERMTYNRRETFGLALAGGTAALVPTTPAVAELPKQGACVSRFDDGWRRGFEGQRVADLGDGRFLNPLIAGDHLDPAILKDGADSLHDLLQLRFLSGADDLAQPRPGELATAKGRADEEHRLGLGGQSREA